MGVLKKLASDTAVYGVSSIVGRMLTYLLVPIYTRVLGQDQYGIVTEFYAYAAFFNVLYVYGMETAFFRYSNIYKEQGKKVYQVAATSVIATSVLLSSLLYFNAESIACAIGYCSKGAFIEWFSIIFAIDAVLAIPFARLRQLHKAKLFATAKLSNIALNLGLNLFFIKFCPMVWEVGTDHFLYSYVAKVYDPAWSIEYIFISNLIANAALFLFLGKFLLQFRPQMDFKLLKPMLVYGFPILITGLAFATNEMLSRVVLKYWLPDGFYPGMTKEEALGVFGAVFKLSIFMNLAIQAFRYAAEPFFFQQAENKNNKALYAKVMHWYVIFGMLVCVGVALNLDVIQYILGKDFRVGVHVVPILLFANFFYGVYYNLSVWYKLSDKTYFGTIITAVAAVVTIVLNYVLIPLYGYEGSSVVSLLSFGLMAFLSYVLSRKHYVINYALQPFFFYTIIAALFIWIGFRFVPNGTPAGFVWHQIMLVAFVLLILVKEKLLGVLLQKLFNKKP